MTVLLQSLPTRTLQIYLYSNHCSVEKDDKLCNFSLSPQMVLDKLKKLKMNKAPGIDLTGTTLCLKKSSHLYTLCNFVTS